MVHRPSDSRLLVNLLSHEKEYAKQLSTLLESSQASLASFSAYASASAPPASQIIIQVAGALAGADEALRKYASSLEHWQEQLKSLRDLEDEVGNIMRDREILVTRLIKVSKNQKSTRDTILATSSSSSTLSVARPEVQIGSKLAAAQSELQACEAHLAAKERELDVMRTAAVRSGLSTRCKALVECGWMWGEMGKEGLRALETMESSHPNGNGYAHPLPSRPPYQRPLLENGNGNGIVGQSSDLSSIGPSQSASQNTHFDHPIVPPKSYSLHIPPAHSISDHTFPDYYGRENESGGGSSDEEEREVEVHENERFSSVSRGNGLVKALSPSRSAVESNRRVHFPTAASMPVSPSLNNVNSKSRQRRSSTSVFGSIAAFFHHNKGAGGDDQDDSSPTRTRSYWQTRTDRNLARRGRDDSDDEARPSTYPVTMPPSLITDSPPPQNTAPQSMRGSQRLRKRMNSAAPNSPSLGASAPKAQAEDKGWVSDGAASRPNAPKATGSVRSKKKGKTSKKESTESPTSPVAPVNPASQSPAKATAAKPKEPQPTAAAREKEKEKEKESAPAVATQSATTKSKKPGTVLPATLPTEAALSRNSSLSKHSIISAASAPVGISSQPNPTIYPATPVRHGSTNAHKRATSLDSPGGRTPGAKAGKKHGAAVGHSPLRNNTTTRANTQGEQSLMSIVEGVTKQNRVHRGQQDPNSMLIMAKAPPPVSVSIDMELEALASMPLPQIPATQHEHRPEAMTREASERSVPLTPSIPAPEPPILHVPSPELKPLRSALRNTSRSPSPSTSLTLSPPVIPVPLPPVPARSKLRPSPPQPPPPELPALPNGSATQTQTGKEFDDASSTTSSYETTQEMLDEDFTEPSTPVASPQVPPKPLSEPTVAVVSGSDLSNSNSTTSNGTLPTRRKSVRMSLPPTFSTTPPAFDDDKNDEREPWSAPATQHRHHEPRTPTQAQVQPHATSWSSKIKEPVERDIWQDTSDDEDEEYNRAKQLLSRASRSPKKKRI